jgi:hypothetical protein
MRARLLTSLMPQWCWPTSSNPSLVVKSSSEGTQHVINEFESEWRASACVCACASASQRAIERERAHARAEPSGEIWRRTLTSK